MNDVSKAKAQKNDPEGIWAPALKEAGMAFVTAVLLLAIFYVFAFRWIHPEFVPFMDREASKLIAPGKDLIPVSVGGYRVEVNSAIIEDFNGDEAILALPRSFKAEDYPFIKVNLEGFTRYSKFKILWRRADNPSVTHALEFNRSGDEVTQIAMVYGNQNYRGRIADLALLFYDGPAIGFESNGGADIAIESIELRPFSTWHVAEQIYEDWSNPPLWAGHSNNIVRGTHPFSLLFPNAVFSLAALLGTSLVWSWRKLRQSNSMPESPAIAVALCLCLFSFGITEALRWSWRAEQLLDSKERYGNLPLADRIKNNEIRCARFPDDCGKHFMPYF